MDNYAWGKAGVKEFLKRVVPPGEALKTLDDRMLYNEALELADMLGEDGILLREELLKMGALVKSANATIFIPPTEAQ